MDISKDISMDTWFLVPGTGNLFATKWVHIKHYRLKIGRPNFWWDSASFLNSKNPEITQTGSTIPGTCYSGKKRPLPGSLQTVVRRGEAPPRWSIHQIQSRFWSKNDFFQKSKKVPTNTANWSCGLINPSGHFYFDYYAFWGTFWKIKVFDLFWFYFP